MTAEVKEAIEAIEVLDLQRKLPGVQGEIGRMEAALIDRVLREVVKGSLTPQQALYAWLEVASYRQLSRRLNAKVKLGQVVVDKVGREAQKEAKDG